MKLKTMALGVPLMLAALLMGGRDAHAQGQWCAYYDPMIYNCGFSTYQQCLETIRGVGGGCSRNYRAPRAMEPEPRQRRKTKKRRR